MAPLLAAAEEEGCLEVEVASFVVEAAPMTAIGRCCQNLSAFADLRTTKNYLP